MPWRKKFTFSSFVDPNGSKNRPCTSFKGRVVTADLTPEFRKGLFFENGLKLVIYRHI
jgi:hypothetical protein